VIVSPVLPKSMASFQAKFGIIPIMLILKKSAKTKTFFSPVTLFLSLGRKKKRSLALLNRNTGSGEKEYQKNYPGTKPGTFNKIVTSLKGLAQIKKEKGTPFPSVSLHRPINHDNFQGVEAMAHIAHATCSNKVSFSPFKTRRKELAHFALSNEEEKRIKATLQQMQEKLQNLSLNSNIGQTLLRYDIGESVWEKLPCYIGWIHLRIKVDGTVLPCNSCSVPIGSLNKNTLAEIWNGRAMRDFRRETITREGLSRMNENCDCGFCCHTLENVRIHRIFKWLSPFRRNRGIKEMNLKEELKKRG
jgi:hypothetical protein